MPYQTKFLTQPDFPNQRGSTCGLYALEGILRAFDPQTKFRATGDHKNRPDWQHVISLRYIAKNILKISVIGEVFSAKDLATLAQEVGLKANVYVKMDWQNVIKSALDAGKYVIAPFGVNPATGQPQLDGTRAHYCVIFAYALWSGGKPVQPVFMPFPGVTGGQFTLDPHSFCIVRHWGKNHAFVMETFRESSQKLGAFPQQHWKKDSGTTNLRYNPSKASVTGAKKIPFADLPKSLSDQLIVVGKSV